MVTIVWSFSRLIDADKHLEFVGRRLTEPLVKINLVWVAKRIRTDADWYPGLQPHTLYNDVNMIGQLHIIYLTYIIQGSDVDMLRHTVTSEGLRCKTSFIYKTKKIILVTSRYKQTRLEAVFIMQ